MEMWRRGGVMTVALAAVTIALSLGVASALGHPSPHDQRSETPAFTITSVVYDSASGPFPAASCSGPGALLYPGLTRCLIFTVQNLRHHPITVTQITASLDPAYPSPPPQCAGNNLELPAFSGSLVVAAMSSASTPGEPLTLKDSGTNQDACENFLYHFSYVGDATSPARTHLDLDGAPNPVDVGALVTLDAHVSSDYRDATGVPQGAVTFYLCATDACAETTELGVVAVDPGGDAVYSTSSLAQGANRVYAVFTPSSDLWSGTQSSALTEVVGPTGDHDHDHGDGDDADAVASVHGEGHHDTGSVCGPSDGSACKGVR